MFACGILLLAFVSFFPLQGLGKTLSVLALVLTTYRDDDNKLDEKEDEHTDGSEFIQYIAFLSLTPHYFNQLVFQLPNSHLFVFNSLFSNMRFV